MAIGFRNTMWTGGKSPRIPVVTPSKGEPFVKNSTVNAELAALKQRGLAKILNRHFTETASKLAVEKAAADAACRDLEERKARTSEFKESGNLGLSPLDQERVQANKWRSECRRKEKETLLLYQRYVHKFGDSGVDVALFNPVENSKTSAPPPTRLPPQRPSAMSTLVPSMTAQIETALEEYLKQGGLAHPSVMTHGKEMTFSTAAAKEEAVFRDHYRRLLEQRGVDAVCGAGYYKASLHGDIDIFTRTIVPEEMDAAISAGAAALENLPIDNVPNQNDDDVFSIVSGLTLHSAMTRDLLQDCERSVQTFLRDEQAHIRRIIEEEEDSEDSSDDNTAIAVLDAKKTANEAESMVQQMQDILIEYQKHHPEKEPELKGRPYPTSNKDEDWMVYFDELYKQEYFHEKKSNRTQWEPPDRELSGSFSTDVYSVMNGGTVHDFSETGDFTDGDTKSVMSASGRLAAYRRKRRQEKRRRRVFLAFISSVLALSALAYWQCEVKNQRQCLEAKELLVEYWNDFVSGGEYRKAREAEALRMLLEQELLVRQESEAEEERRLQAVAAAEEEARVALEEAERQRALMLRPWACNLPFAYLFHSRCGRLAHQNPMFDLQSLIQSMLQ